MPLIVVKMTASSSGSDQCFNLLISICYIVKTAPCMFGLLHSNLRKLKTSAPNLVCLGSWKQFEVTAGAFEQTARRHLKIQIFSSEPLKTISSPPLQLFPYLLQTPGKVNVSANKSIMFSWSYRVWICCFDLLHSDRISAVRCCRNDWMFADSKNWNEPNRKMQLLLQGSDQIKQITGLTAL